MATSAPRPLRGFATANPADDRPESPTSNSTGAANTPGTKSTGPASPAAPATEGAAAAHPTPPADPATWLTTPDAGKSPATKPEPARPERTGPRTADLPATAPAGFDALAADQNRTVDSGRRPVTPSPLAWSEAEDSGRQDFFASRPVPHQAPASTPAPNYPSGPNQWGRVVPLRPPSQPEPPGALVFEDVIYPLDRAYVVGRNPSGDESVRSGTAAPLTLPRDRHVSRVHAYVTVDNGVVYVRDAGTSGGTYIAAPGVEQWTRVGDTAVELAPGWRMRLGQKILTYRPPMRPMAAYPRRY